MNLSNNSRSRQRPEFGGPDDLPALAASQRLRITYTITLTGSGSGYLGFCVDSVPGESDTTNNCSASTHVTVRSSSNQNTANIADGVSLVVEEALLRIEPAGGPDHKQELQGLRHMIVGAFSSGGKR